jgi:hypothetical protein
MAGSARKGGLRPLPKKPPLDAVRNEINVTPFVDICLVLLIIFMVITPLMARGKEVPLPTTENQSNEKDKLQPVVSVGMEACEACDKTIKVWLAGASAQGKMELEEIGPLSDFTMDADGDEPSDSPSRDKLAKEVKRLWEVAKNEESKGRLYLKVAADPKNPENDLPYELVYPLLMAINEDLGLSSIDLGTAEKKGGK